MYRNLNYNVRRYRGLLYLVGRMIGHIAFFCSRGQFQINNTIFKYYIDGVSEWSCIAAVTINL
jgi:hypothetical protein